MKKALIVVMAIILSVIDQTLVYSQKYSGSIDLITSSDMESHVSFLASPLLRGRENGEDGLEIAGQYIEAQAKLIGLKPANGDSYLQPYSVTRKKMDPVKSNIRVSDGKDTAIIKEPVFPLIPIGPSDFVIEGEVVFAGYGIKSDKYNYNDFKDINPEGKILLVMDRAPLSEDGKTSRFEEPGWMKEMNFQMKLTTLILSRAKAILFVADPKSGFLSVEESNPMIAGYLNVNSKLKGEKEETINPFMAGMPKVIFIHRAVADALLTGTGHSLKELQESIDSSIQPRSFAIPGKLLQINQVSLSEEVVLNNIAGYIEGSDKDLKNEVVVFSSHYDHIGMSGDKVNTGADDDASGCAALLSIAEAFADLRKKPLRSVLFLWVSGEEIGLFGSKSYVENPLFPLEKTIANLNMDMVGRVKSVADSTSETPMSGPETVFVITANQSRELGNIAEEIDKKSKLDFDYSLSGRDHPLQLFQRSDHYNFVKKDIPVLFVSTGLHTDYHTPGDVVEKLDFRKMELIARAMFEIGFTVANKKSRLMVDNPYSSW
jgi:hypothetical protein